MSLSDLSIHPLNPHLHAHHHYTTMSPSRLPFLYPFLRRSVIAVPRRHRHGSAVEPTQFHPDPPPPPPPLRSDSDTRGPGGEVASEMVEIAGRNTADLRAEAAAPKPDEMSVSLPMPTSPAEADRPFASRDYTHHFDTYASVQRLSAGGFSQSQSIVAMKLLRALLDKNLADARENLVSKSNIENETYLFQAACSELRNEMQNAKKMAVEDLRSERTRIQTEFDLLNQKFLAEIMELRDELSSMFNDRKMVTRAEQRAMENKVCFPYVRRDEVKERGLIKLANRYKS